MTDGFPHLVPIQQKLYDRQVGDLESAVRSTLAQARIGQRLKPGERIAITAGSRGICNIASILRYVVDAVRAAGAEPFLVPAMGSHGGATAEGQLQLLETLGVTEASVGARIRSSMETVHLGKTLGGWDVFMDSHAYHADGIIVVNRVKPHTDFRGEYESGLMKMMCIGLGKRNQPEVVHSLGTQGLREIIPEVAHAVLATGKVRMGLAILENGYGQTAEVLAVPPEQIPEREKELLRAAKRHHPSLPFEEIDILIVDQIGKEISGAGMDTNVIGRLDIRGESRWVRKPRIATIVLLDVSDASHGNTVGTGLADITTQRLIEKTDPRATYTNLMISTFVDRGKMPPAYPTDREAIETALFLHRAKPLEDLRVARIQDTLHIDRLAATPNLLNGGQAEGRVRVLGEPSPLRFDDRGNLQPLRAGE